MGIRPYFLCAMTILVISVKIVNPNIIMSSWPSLQIEILIGYKIIGYNGFRIEGRVNILTVLAVRMGGK